MLLDNVVIVDETGGTINLKSCATVTVSGMNITIQAYNNSYVKMIEKGIQQSNLGLTPNVNGTSIKLFLPPLTEETRKNLLKVVSETGNTFKTSVKQVREQSMKKLKAMKADKLLPEDDFKVNEKAIETQIQNCNSLIDDLLKKKEKDITEI